MPPSDGPSAQMAYQIWLLSRVQAGYRRCAMAFLRFDGGIPDLVRGELAGISWLQACRMIEPREFRPIQAEETARAFNEQGVEYLFIGKSGAILLGYPGTTQDVDIFPASSSDNGRRIVAALRKMGFEISSDLEREIVTCKDFVQIKTGPFDVDLVFAPDGITNFSQAK